MSIRATLLATGILATSPAGSLIAQDAHVHGIAAINLVIDNAELEIEFESPAANIVGFEYRAETAKDKQAIRNALQTLKNPEAMFGLPESAGCKLEDAKADLHGYEEDHDGHDDHKEAHDDKHDTHDNHREAHSEFHAHHHFECDKPSELTLIALPLFDSFPSVEKIQLQAITPWGQFGGVIEARDAQIKLK